MIRPMTDEWKPMETPDLQVVRSSAYDPNKSQVTEDRLATWLAEDMSSDIQSVPGIGSATAKKIAVDDDGVTTTHQLIGRFLTLKTPGATAQEHGDAFWFWLQSKKVNQYRSGIVQCIMEKVEIMMPALYQEG